MDVYGMSDGWDTVFRQYEYDGMQNKNAVGSKTGRQEE